jgi:NAD(P)H-dependent flavin oxidoreductase YrpB (nitropropane dioxygenase family)
MPSLSGLGLSVPIVAAPMAGGPTTPELVVAADRAGGIGFLAAGYLSADALKTKIGAVRRQTSHLGVSLFAPNPVPVDRTAYRAYRERLRADADRLGVALPEDPVEDDDGWRDKVDLLTDAPVPVVSFTFGVPERAVLDAFHAVGSVLVQTVTSADEARLAEAAGVDALAVQSSAAGGHWGTLTPGEPPSSHAGLGQLLAEVGAASELPIIAAGGIADAATVRAALTAGAAAVAVGTVLMLSPEAGTSATHRAALATGDRPTVVTKAFTGRPARGLRNAFIDRYDDLAPFGYPALHHLTSPIRGAAAAAGDPELLHLWAGTGYRAATTDPAEVIMRQLTAQL